MLQLRFFFLALIALVLVACDSATSPTPTPPVDDPEFLIRNVTLSPEVINAGVTAQLAWEAASDDVAIEIEPGVGVFTGSGYVDIAPLETTVYSLTARLGEGEPQTVTKTLQVLPPTGEGPEGPMTLNVTVLTRDAAALPNIPLDGLPLSFTHDPLFDRMRGVLWAGLASAWMLTPPEDSEPVTIAYLGDGVRTTHEDIQAGVLLTDKAWNFCPDLSCSGPGSRDIDNSDPTGTYTYDVAQGTTAIGPLIAASDNGLGAASVAGPHDGVLQVIPLKVMHTEPRYAGGEDAYPAWTEGTVEAYIDALRYALGEDIGIPGLGALDEPVDIIYLGAIFQPEPTDDEADELERLLEVARTKGVLIIADSRTLNDFRTDDESGYEGRVNYFTDIAKGYRDIILSVQAYGHDDAFQDVYSDAWTESPNPQDDDEYSDTNGVSVIVGVAALLQHHDPELRGALLRDRMLEHAVPYTEFDAPKYWRYFAAGSVRADLALGLPGPGSKVTVNLMREGELMQSLNGTLNPDGSLRVTFDFQGEPGEYTFEATIANAEHELYGQGSTALWHGSNPDAWVTLATLR